MAGGRNGRERTTGVLKTAGTRESEREREKEGCRERNRERLGTQRVMKT